MTTLHHQVRIEAPVEAVWRAVAGDLTAVQHYNKQVSSARLLNELTQGLGAARRCELIPKGFVEERVWEWRPNAAIGLEVTASEWPIVFMRWKTKLKTVGAATIVEQELNYKLRFGPFGALMDALILRRKLDQGVRVVFEDLKRYVER